MRYARLLVAKLILFAITPVMAQAGTSGSNVNSYAYGYFLGLDGSQAWVNLIRIRDVAGTVTTELYYTFCGVAGTGTACQRGDGIVPPASVAGGVSQNVNGPSTFSIQVDTSAILGYRNQLCTLGTDLDGDCLGALPATGGLVAVTWSRTPAWAYVNTGTFKNYQLGKVVGSGTSLLASFSAKQGGTVLGVDAVGSESVMVTSTDSQTLQTQFQAGKRKH